MAGTFLRIRSQHLNIWVMSVSMDQILTPCLPGRGLVPWVTPVTHRARTAHQRPGVVSKQGLTGQCPVVRVMNERWMDGALSVRRGIRFQEKGFNRQYRTRWDEVSGLQCGFSPLLFHHTFIAQESPCCFCQPLCIKASVLLEKLCRSAVATDIHSELTCLAW